MLYLDEYRAYASVSNGKDLIHFVGLNKYF